jgi:Ca-activated chloride channel family protein
VQAFAAGAMPVTLGLVVDRSQSMRPKEAALRLAVSTILGSVRPDDELFAVGFDDGASFALPPDRPFTSEAAELEAALATMTAGGRTALYDGVALGLARLDRGRSGRKVLVVVSDGGDNASRQTYDGVLDLARRSAAVIYAVGLTGTPPVEEEEDLSLLSRLCRDTGGVAYLPRTASEVVGVAGTIVRDIQAQYMLGFTPGPVTPGRAYRTIEVRVERAGGGRLHVRARRGFVMPGDPGSSGHGGVR